MDIKQTIISLKEKRFTYQKIGDILGISRQRVHQIFTGYKSPSSVYKPILLERIPLETGIKETGRDYTREIIRKRDNYTCQICNKIWEKGQRKFDVHHKDFDKEKTRQYDNFLLEKDNMITLCHKCHLNLEEHRISMKRGKNSLSTGLENK